MNLRRIVPLVTWGAEIRFTDLRPCLFEILDPVLLDTPSDLVVDRRDVLVPGALS